MFYMWQIHIGKDQSHGIPGFLRDWGKGKKWEGIMRQGRENTLCLCIHLKEKKKNQKNNPPHPKQPLTHTSLFSKTKLLLHAAQTHRYPALDLYFSFSYGNQASISAITVDSSNHDVSKGQNTSGPCSSKHTLT